mmetsp:Transcript_28254/g.66335  ORF Transcript_28254/g.66335 Transcript_28254/m.66335 type:complete len:111 (+) Transcript_28254:132-464(+)
MQDSQLKQHSNIQHCTCIHWRLLSSPFPFHIESIHSEFKVKNSFFDIFTDFSSDDKPCLVSSLVVSEHHGQTKVLRASPTDSASNDHQLRKNELNTIPIHHHQVIKTPFS